MEGKNQIHSPLIMPFIAIVVLLIVIVNSIMVYSFLKLSHSVPLNNVSGSTNDLPISISDRDNIIIGAEFSRDIACSLIDFKVTLENTKDHGGIFLSQFHVIDMPMINVAPTGQHTDSMLLSLPARVIYPGDWQVSFHGEYKCQYGLFLQHHSQSFTAGVVKIIK